MMCLNRVTLLGIVTSPVKLGHSVKGFQYLTLSMATNEKRKKHDGTYLEITEWHKLKLWGDRAETLAKYVKKGDALFVEGRIEARKYTNKEGLTVNTHEILVETFRLIGKTEKRPFKEEKVQEVDVTEGKTLEELGADDIPF